MPQRTVRYPVEVTSVGLVDDAPERTVQNHDVAFMLASRFNVRMLIGKRNRWSHLEGRHLVESDDYDTYWRRRLEIFERVCIPSVLNLTPRPDAWFIAFGDVESSYVREAIERLSLHPWIKPYVRKKGHPTDAKPLGVLLSDHANVLGKSFLCSTRFDSDDSLHQQFIGALDRAISRLRAEGFDDEARCLNFPYGLVQSDGELSVFMRRSNMFESIFEPVDGAGGPYRGNHDEIRDRMPLVEIVTNLPMWIYHRHENTLEPAWATARDRLPLSPAERYFPMFGLAPDTGAVLNSRSHAKMEVLAGTDGGASAGSGSGSLELSAIPYWRQDQVDIAIELAGARGQPVLARWLAAPVGAGIDAARVWREIESGPVAVLNGPRFGALGRSLLEAGDPVAALQAFDYAVVLSPTDRHIRAERDALAGSLLCEIELGEQMELAGIQGPVERKSDIVVLVTQAPDADAGAAVSEPVQEYAGQLAKAGFVAHIILLAASDGAHGDGQPAIEPNQEGAVMHLPLAPVSELGVDAARRVDTRRFADYVAELCPGLLVADGSLVAQSLAVSVGRAFAIPIGFIDEPVPDSGDSAIGT